MNWYVHDSTDGMEGVEKFPYGKQAISLAHAVVRQVEYLCNRSSQDKSVNHHSLA